MSRDEIIEMIARLPVDATEADVIQALHFRLQVERGARDAAEGRVISHSELKERMADRPPLQP